MAHAHTCHKHEERPLVAYCASCQRPCCRDCTVEIFEHHFCEACKQDVTESISNDEVQSDAMRAVMLATVGIFAAGFAIGPYAIWRAHSASKILEQTPWLRGKWHVRAAYLLGALATVQGLLFLWGRTMSGGS